VQIVILAGGLGTRLRPITERIPKPMVDAGGRPFLEHIVRHLANQNFQRLLLLIGHLGEQVRDYFEHGQRFRVQIEYESEPAPLGTAGAVRNALSKLDEEFILLYGDSYLPIDHWEVVQAFQESPCPGLIVVYDNRNADTGVANNVALGRDGYVRRYEKGRAAADLHYVEAGVLCFRREVFANLPAGEPISLEDEIYPQLIAQNQLRGFVTQQRFFDIGTHGRLAEFVETRL
jgi:mannose-1-phosphate guanylyltransferase